MLRQALARVAASSGSLRSLSTSAASSAAAEGAAAAAADAGAASRAAFLEKLKPFLSATSAPPSFPTDFMAPKPAVEAGAGVPEKLTLNFFMPHQQPKKGAAVDLVLVPAVTGDFGVMPGHVPTVAQLRPGVLTIHTELDKSVEKYFVSAGFAFVHADSTADVCAVEAVKVEDLDPEAVRAGLAEYIGKLASSQAKGDDYETAAAQIGVEVYSAMNAAVGA